MKQIISLLVAIALCLIPGPVVFSADDGTFRGKWWNYYDRGLSSADSGDWTSAVNDLQQCIKMQDRDQRMARTYGMHFIDYFPHRELGIAYMNRGELDKAAKELELSAKQEESAKASFYLNKVQQSVLKQSQAKPAGPEITIVSPASGTIVKTSTVTIKGKASGKGIVSRIVINGTPYRFDRAREHMEFTQELAVEDGSNEIVVAAEDLVGNKTEKTLTLIVDRDGPSVQIADVVAEQEAGKRYIKLTGTVSDATWISKLQVNGQSVDVSGEKNHQLNLRFEQGKKAKLAVLAVDPFENETTAEIDVEQALTAFRTPEKPFLIAFNSDKLIGFDKTSPQITLKSSADLPTVFSEKYAVEGEASDNLNIGRIVINNKDVFVKNGKRIFFSKVVDLREGKNTITVDVYDTSDNKTTKTYTVTRRIPSVMQNASRMSITVLPFDGGKTADRIQLAYDQLLGAFVDQKRFSVIERAKLEHILLEQKLTKEKLTDPENSIRVGKLMSADAVLATSVREDERSLEIVARVISTETSEVLGVKDAFVEDKTMAGVRDLVANLAAKVAQEFPVAEGMVVKAGGKSVVMDVGEASNIKRNMTVIIYRKGEEIRHPVTGKSLGWDTIKVGEGRVEEVQAAFSKVRLLDRPNSQQVKVKDLVMTK